MSLRLALEIAGGFAAAFTVGALVYLLGSYALMRRHVEPRPLRAWLRAMLFEALTVFLTQPLLPLFYLIGARSSGTGTHPVVFVHGYMQNRVDFLGLSRWLKKRGLGPFLGFNYPWYEDIASSGRRLARYLERLAGEGIGKVDLVCHSMGGLVALEAIRAGGAPFVRRVVTIATPHQGVQWRGPVIGRSGPQLRFGNAFLSERSDRVPVPVLSIFDPHDNVVHPASTSMLLARGGEDASVAGAGHLSILFLPEVAERVAAFLLRDDAPANAAETNADPVASAAES